VFQEKLKHFLCFVEDCNASACPSLEVARVRIALEDSRKRADLSLCEIPTILVTFLPIGEQEQSKLFVVVMCSD